MNWLNKVTDEIRLQRSARSVASLELTWRLRGGWLGAHLPEARLQLPPFAGLTGIERRAARTSRLGVFALHQSYREEGAIRRPGDVRSSPEIGRLYQWLVVRRRPDVIVEFGTAFGVSGMYLLSGLETNGRGELLTFEINEAWREVAVRNLAETGTRYRSIAGSFEANVDAALESRQIDLAFIDAIHTSAWVLPQFELVVDRMANGGLVMLDDIDFSGDMQAAWNAVARHPRVLAAVSVSDHLGMVEIKGGDA
jgi:predicted O-methyltransferase YrrM